MPYRILSSDLLLADIVVDYNDNSPQPLKDLVASLRAEGKMLPGGKMSIDKETAIRFARAIIGDDPNREIKDVDREYIEAVEGLKEFHNIPGGSSANTLVTMAKSLARRIAVDFLGVIDGMQHDEVIEKSLTDVGINRFPPRDELPANAESALSFVIRFANGERAIATYPGNAKDILKGSMISEDHVNRVDAVLLQGGLDRKLGDTQRVRDGLAEDKDLGVADTLLKWRYEKGKELWLTLPTQADFGSDHWEHGEKAEHMRTLIKGANVVLGNGEELARTYTNSKEYDEIKSILKRAEVDGKKLTAEEIRTTDRISDADRKKYDLVNHSILIDEALSRLKKDLDKQVLMKKANDRDNRWTGSTYQVAFITLGAKGAAVVTGDREDNKGYINKIPARHIDERRKEKNQGNTLGCGDTAYAGFLMGYLAQGLQHGEEHYPGQRQEAYKQAAVLGMALAGAKLEETAGPRLYDPMAWLWSREEGLAEMVASARITSPSDRAAGAGAAAARWQ